MSRKKFWLSIGLITLCTLGLKGWLLLSQHVPFNADEAVVALMARHIRQGDIPLFFYGQSYMGSMDAFLVSGGFAIFGEEVWVIRLVQSVLYLGTVLTTVEIGRQAFHSDKVGILAAIFLAVPTVNVTLYTTASLGGYGEALFIGNLNLILGFRIAKKLKERGRKSRQVMAMMAAWGILAGLGLWIFGITLVYSLPVAAYLVWHLREHREWSFNIRAYLWMFWGGILGSMPWWVYAFRHGVKRMFLELLGSAISGANQIPYALQPLVHLYHLLLLGSTVTFGLRPPWNVRWLMLPLAPFALLFWAGTLVFIPRSVVPTSDNGGKKLVILGVILLTVAGFLFTPFGADPSGRYFLPLAPPLSLFAAEMVLTVGNKNRIFAAGLIAFVLVFNLGGTVQSARRSDHGLTTQFDQVARIDHSYDQELIHFLRMNDVDRGYTNYWVAYPLAFLSGEELIFIPKLPYHHDFRYTSRDHRYQPYQEVVEESKSAAYITTHHPELDEVLRSAFSEKGVSWSEKQIGDYRVFYGLDQKVTPEEIGLGGMQLHREK